ncbi:MAG: monooxygenase [Citromicrobium sp.]|nr:MAG: monooxygenase [Citromicrobium sp.]
MGGHALFITHRTQPGKRDAVRDVWMRHMAPAVGGNAGHLAYFYCYDAEDGDILRVFQLYADEAAATAFLEHPNYRTYLEEVEGLLAGPPDVHPAEPQWSKPSG